MPPEKDMNASPATTVTPEAPEVKTPPAELVEPTEAEAMAAMTAGYNKQRGIEETPPVKEPAAEEPPAVPDTPAAAATPPVEEAPQPPAAPSVEERLEALQKNIATLDGTPASVRKIYGELGNINRVIQELQKKGAEGASGEPSAEMTAAIAEAEKIGVEFPEIAGPLVAAIKALSSQRTIAAPAAPAAIDPAVIQREVAKIRQQDAIELLAEDHPDYETVRDTPEYKEWLASKPADFQERFKNTWNAAIVSKGLTEFKTWRAAAQAAKDAKEKRLKAALTPQGEGSAGGPSTLPDDAGLSVGYNKVRRQRTAAAH